MRGLALLLASLAIGAFGAVWGQESPSYLMDRVTVVGGSGTATSGNFDTSVIVAQNTASGAASRCNVGFQTSLGFWSILGQGRVPIQLQVALNETNPEDLDLSWSGAEAQFQVYRAFTPDDVTNPNNLLVETTDCAASESMPTTADIVYYQVVPSP